MSFDPDRREAEEWGELERLAKECQHTWGIGFPVISLALLQPIWDQFHSRVREEGRQEGAEAERQKMAELSIRTMKAIVEGPK